VTTPSPRTSGPIDRRRIDAALVRRLLEQQFPDWAPLAIRPWDRSGNDHRMFRLGDELCVRLPSAPDYAPQDVKEQRWLPRLAAAGLPLPIPSVRGAGVPTSGFAAHWSVLDWLPGEPASVAAVDDEVRFAADLAAFLAALRRADASDGPQPGLHSAYRGGPLDHWDDEVAAIVHRVDGAERDRARGLWRDALAAPFRAAPVWVHGDVAGANLLVRDGRLSAVVDFGCSAVGDPACDTVMLWTRFRGRARDAFREGLALDDDTWARGRGWALWKGLIMLTNTVPGQAEFGRRVLDELFAGA
jgi:aminoglycoside phosphotransferase (APT) family kinase protein